jgi:hypothetical protein
MLPLPTQPCLQIVMAVAVSRRRLPIPMHCPAPLSELIWDCWQHDAAARPSFADILSRLRALQQHRAPETTLPSSPLSKPPIIASECWEKESRRVSVAHTVQAPAAPKLGSFAFSAARQPHPFDVFTPEKREKLSVRTGYFFAGQDNSR